MPKLKVRSCDQNIKYAVPTQMTPLRSLINYPLLLQSFGAAELLHKNGFIKKGTQQGQFGLN